jgi:hypothetical protein
MQPSIFTTPTEGKKNSDLRFLLGIGILLVFVLVYFSLSPKSNKVSNFAQASASVGR